MPRKQRADVEQYIDHFRGEHAKLKEGKHRLHRKVLVVTMLDALARGRNPNARSRDRFINLIEEHSDWPHATSISASQLAMMIQERGGDVVCGASDDFVKWLDDWCGTSRGESTSWTSIQALTNCYHTSAH
jgi:hypothetical protein